MEKMNYTKVTNKLGAISGLIASILYISGEIITDLADLNVTPYSSSDTIVNAFVERTNQILIGTYLLMLAAFLFIWFISYVWQILSDNNKDVDWILFAAFGGGLVTVAMFLLSAHFTQASTVVQNYLGDRSAAKALYILNWNWYLLVEAPALAAFILGVSLTGMKTKRLPIWLCGLGGLNAFLLLAPAVSGSGIILSMVWISILSIIIFRKQFI